MNIFLIFLIALFFLYVLTFLGVFSEKRLDYSKCRAMNKAFHGFVSGSISDTVILAYQADYRKYMILYSLPMYRRTIRRKVTENYTASGYVDTFHDITHPSVRDQILKNMESIELCSHKAFRDSYSISNILFLLFSFPEYFFIRFLGCLELSERLSDILNIVYRIFLLLCIFAALILIIFRL